MSRAARVPRRALVDSARRAVISCGPIVADLQMTSSDPQMIKRLATARMDLMSLAKALEQEEE